MFREKIKIVSALAILLVVPFIVVGQVQLSKVKGLNAKNVTTNSAKISWSKTNEAKYYQLRLQNRNGETIKTWKELSNNSKNIPASLGLLTQGKKYQVKVRACIKNDCSKWSDIKSFTTLIDADDDGVDSTLDCNDEDQNASSNITYYADADGDGLGDDNSSTVLCSNTASSGYVANANDANDDDYDNDSHVTASDCNDLDATVYTIYYADVDQDGLGNPNSTSCAGSSAPTSYVSNANDLDDNDYFNGNYPVCSSDTYNCTDFSTQFRAQKYYDYCVAQGAGDIHNLDGDADGEACESLN